MSVSATFSQDLRGVGARTSGYVPVYGQEKEIPSGGAAPVRVEEPARSLSFKDFVKGLIDVINPLHHIPFVGTLYRRLTKDEIGPVTRVTGDALYGGPVVGALGLAETAVFQATGKDAGETALSVLRGEKKPKAPPTPPDSGTVWSARDIIWNDQDYTAPLPPAAVPARMAEALDKYAAMKQAGLSPAPASFSGSF